tara:strand:+ start:48150 stop:48749 length:600 start_codon:yes stop_codon:yes gene_type:complete
MNQRYHLLKKYLPENQLNLLRKLYKPIKYSHYSKGDLLLAQETSKLFFKQFINDFFNRYDLIVIYLAIEQYFNKNNIGYDLYEKMQMKRMEYRGDRNDRHNTINEFKGLLKNIEKNGYDYQSSITIDRNQKLCDGAHRFSSAIYFKLPVIPIKMLRQESDIIYGIDWFKNNNFNLNELEIIKHKGEEIFSDIKIKGITN